MSENKITVDNMLTRAEATFAPSTIDIEKRTVDVVMSTETPYLRRSYQEGRYNEILDHTPTSVRLKRANKGAPVLDMHDRYGSVGKKQIGVIQSVRFEGRQLIGKLKFSRKPEADVIFQDIVDGIIRNFSVGYAIHGYEDGEKYEDGRPFERRVTDWELLEVSAVSVPADENAQVRAANDGGSEIFNNPKESQMSKDKGIDGEVTRKQDAPAATTATRAEAPVTAPTTQKPPVDVEAIRTAERARAIDIRSRLDIAGIVDVDFERTLIEGDFDSAAITDQIRSKWQSQKTASSNGSSDAAVTRDDGDELIVRGLADAICLRAGITKEAPDDNARRFATMRMSRMAEALLIHRGESVQGMSESRMVQKAFQRNGFHSTTDFPIIMEQVINRSLMAAYNGTTQTYRQWTSATTHPDFRVVETMRMSEMVGAINRIPEGGEYKPGTFNESKDGYAVQKWGVLMGYTWEMAINNNTSFFQRAPQAIARQFARTQNELAYQILTGNPTMADGFALFSNEHNNLMTGSALTEANLEAAFTKFELQTDPEGKKINVAPSILIVGPNNRFAAQRILAENPNAATKEAMSTLSGTLRLVVDSAVGDAWFLAADPRDIEGVEHAFLADHPEIYSEAQETFHTDATYVKNRMVFGVKAKDHVGLLMNPGV